MSNKNIVIIGAGYAGVHATKKLAKAFKKDDSVTITLIDRHSYHTMMTELHEVAAHRVEPDAIQFDLRKLFRKSKVRLVTDSVRQLDRDKKTVITDHGAYPYDYLILGIGGEPNDFGIPGVKEHGFTLLSWEDAVKLRRHIEETVRKAATVHDEAKRKAMLTFAVCGSGFTGVEMIGELLEWKRELAAINKLDESDISLILVEAVPTILNMLDRKDAGKAEHYMVKKGIRILTSSPIVKVEADRIVLKSGEEIPTYTLIWTAGVRANSDVKPFGLASAKAGRLKVNPYLEAEGMENIYVVGDLAYHEEDGKPVPQIVEAAEQTGGTAAKNIIASINGGEKTAYHGKYHGVMVSIGARFGVANLMGWRLSSWFANFMKHVVNLYYFLCIHSGYYMFHYIMHEFFHTKYKRNIFRNWSARYGNVLWSVPLRVVVGGFWLTEAFAKIWGEATWKEATSSWSKVHLLFNGIGKDSWLTSDTVKMPFDWLQTTTTGASQAAGSSSDAATQWAAPIFSKMPGWFEWIMKILLPNADVAIFMQKMMLFIELGIGLAILAGLLTWICSAASAGFLVVFILSAMMGWDKFWALPASIALMNGSGRTIGLDYWVVPFLQKFFGRLWYGKSQSVYGPDQNTGSHTDTASRGM
ncbi:FAD-dependent oxidoreductase [Sporolactobacillus sp. THM19-2]|uniref:FAD-dependent oxidoreductase n=1 Tax=Sporolactobacillus sp. THM19-2 TaxID=2511171 RepID=UPI0010206D20|nr:FAD-dependent oxidoreductase [Sporolactobacillus sp. THM19-2]RYL92429.1 NADH dehydrogenase FAD-containing subunit [Sporolactobacillus sp. THM19-2]